MKTLRDELAAVLAMFTAANVRASDAADAALRFLAERYWTAADAAKHQLITLTAERDAAERDVLALCDGAPFAKMPEGLRQRLEAYRKRHGR